MLFLEVPENWEPQKGDIECKPVPRSSEEQKMVGDRWAATMFRVPIKKIERIQNKWLWRVFVLARQRMSERNQGETNEWLLFHGTGVTPPRFVYESEHGFDFCFSKAGLWGTGSYFAVDAVYSATHYAHAVQGRDKYSLHGC